MSPLERELFEWNASEWATKFVQLQPPAVFLLGREAYAHFLRAALPQYMEASDGERTWRGVAVVRARALDPRLAVIVLADGQSRAFVWSA